MCNSKSVNFFKISIAGQNIEVECRYRTAFKQCRDYLAVFDEPDFIIRVSEEEMQAEVSSYPPIKESYKGVATGRSFGQIENVIIQRKIAESLLSTDTFLMHGVAIAYDNWTYILTAPSQTGKTTRSRLWLNIYKDSFVVCDDKPFIKVTDSKVWACGSPWAGKEGRNTNTIIPLRAIFLLERAGKGEESRLEEVSLGEALPFLLQQTHRPKNADLIKTTLNLLGALDGKVKIYKFYSTPTEDSIRLAYETARPK